MANEILGRALEKATGKSIGWLKDTSIDEVRRYAEKIHGKPMRIGRSYDYGLISHEEIEYQLSKILR